MPSNEKCQKVNNAIIIVEGDFKKIDTIMTETSEGSHMQTDRRKDRRN